MLFQITTNSNFYKRLYEQYENLIVCTLLNVKSAMLILTNYHKHNLDSDDLLLT